MSEKKRNVAQRIIAQIFADRFHPEMREVAFLSRRLNSDGRSAQLKTPQESRGCHLLVAIPRAVAR